jgi:hypothetical protein
VGGKRMVATKGRRRICKAMKEDAIVVAMRKMDQLDRETCLMRKMLMGEPRPVQNRRVGPKGRGKPRQMMTLVEISQNVTNPFTTTCDM